MSKQIFIQVSAPPGSGPFNLYTNLNYVTPFATVILPQLTGGYYATVADNVTIIKIEPAGTCTTPIYVSIDCDVTTTTSTSSTTTTTTIPPTTTTSTSSSTTTTTTHPPCMSYSVTLTSGDELTYNYINCYNQEKTLILYSNVGVVYFCAYLNTPIILDGVGVVALISECGVTTTTSSTSSTTTTTLPGFTTTTTTTLPTTTSTSTSTSTSTTSTSTSTTTSTSSSTTTTTKPIFTTTSTTISPTTTTTIPASTTTTTVSGSTTTTTTEPGFTTTTTTAQATTTTTSTPATTTTTTFGGTTTTTTVKPLPTTTTTTIAVSPYDCTCYTLSSESLTGAGYTVFEYVDCATGLLTLTDEIFNNSINICAETGTVGIDFNSKDAEWNIQYTGGTATECNETVDCNPLAPLCTCFTLGVTSPGTVEFLFNDCNGELQTISLTSYINEQSCPEGEICPPYIVPSFVNVCVGQVKNIITTIVSGDPDIVITNNNVPCTIGVEGDSCLPKQCYTLYNLGEVGPNDLEGISTVTYTYWDELGYFVTEVLNYQDVITVCSQTYPEFTEQGYGLAAIKASGLPCSKEIPCVVPKYCNCVIVRVTGDPIPVTYTSCETGEDITVTLGNGYDTALAACMNGYPTIGTHTNSTHVIVEVSKDICSTDTDCNTCNCVTILQAKPTTAIGVYYKECGTLNNAYGLIPELAQKDTFTACMSNAYAPLIWNETDNVEAIEGDDYVITTSGSCLTTNDCLPTTTTTTTPESYYYYSIQAWDTELCIPIQGFSYVMRSAVPVVHTFVCLLGQIFIKDETPIGGPTYDYEYEGVGGDNACISFDFFC